MIVIYLLMAKKLLNCVLGNQSVSGKLLLGNISVDFNQADRKSTGLYGYVYDFSVDYNAITNDKTHDTHRYLMDKNNTK